MKYILGIDIGGTFGKAALFDAEGNQVAVIKRRTQVIYCGNGKAERDLADLKESIFGAIGEVIKKSGVAAERIAAIGLSGHGKGLYTLDPDGREFMNGILSVDSRAQELCEELRLGAAGRYVKRYNFQNILACQPVCILRWLKENDVSAYQKIGTVFSAKDYIRYCLTGRIAAEITDLSGTNLWNLSTKNYDGKLLELFGIEEMNACLPPVIQSFERAGFVTAEAAERTGLKQGTPVCGGMFDIDACALAAGMTDERVVTMIAGTWAINEYICRTPAAAQDAPMNSIYCLDGYYLVEECSPTSAGNLQWWIEQVDSSLTYEQVNRLVSQSPVKDDTFFIPYVTGSAYGGRAKGAFAGLDANCGAGDMLRAIYEGVVFNAKMQLEKLLRFRDPPECIRLAGGVTNSEIWAQMFADILRFPVEIPYGSDCELGCFGAAVAAGIGTGLLADATTFLSSLRRKRIEPDSAAGEVYRKKYGEYLRLLEAMKIFWNQ